MSTHGSIEVADVSFDRETVTFRVNAHRRLKTRTSHRVVPLWPQLAEILRPYTDRRVINRGGTLLFPGETGGMLKDWRKVLDAVAKRAGWKVDEIRCKRFRHTYCAARLQTLDQGAPVSPFTVARELGHSSTTWWTWCTATSARSATGATPLNIESTTRSRSVIDSPHSGRPRPP